MEDESSNGLPLLVQRSKNAVLTMLPVYKMTWSESNNGLYIVHFSNIFILCFFFLKYVFSIVLCYRSDFFCMLYMLWYTMVVVNSLYTFSPPLFLQYSIVYKTLSWYFDALNFYIFPCFSQGGLDLSNFYVVSNHNFLVQRILEKKNQLHSHID